MSPSSLRIPLVIVVFIAFATFKEPRGGLLPLAHCDLAHLANRESARHVPAETFPGPLHLGRPRSGRDSRDQVGPWAETRIHRGFRYTCPDLRPVPNPPSTPPTKTAASRYKIGSPAFAPCYHRRFSSSVRPACRRLFTARAIQAGRPSRAATNCTTITSFSPISSSVGRAKCSLPGPTRINTARKSLRGTNALSTSFKRRAKF